MSENIFSNFYNKVLSFFQKDKPQEGESAKDSATNRLKLVLMQDRSNLDGATMQKMREQLIAVISKYIEIDQEALDLNLEADGDEIALMLNIPVIRARTREEIDEIEAKEKEAQEKLIAKNEEKSEDSEEDEISDNSKEPENQDNESEEEVVNFKEQKENSEKSEETSEESCDNTDLQQNESDYNTENKEENPESKKNKNKNK